MGEKEGVERREFLVLGGAAAAAVALGGCGSNLTQGSLTAGTVSGLEVGGARAVEGEPLIVARDDLGLYAMTAVCTHMGCTVAVEGERLSCPCHGSAFSLDGAVVEGPANEPLQHFQVNVSDAGEITVDTTQPVDTSARTPAPS